MIVMSYRSPWENRGTERGEVGRGNPRTRKQKQAEPQPDRSGAGDPNRDRTASIMGSAENRT